MDFEKFTERARGFVQAAQTIAMREYNQQITPEHLLKAFLDDEEGAASGLIRMAGGDPAVAKRAADEAVHKIPKVQGSGAGQPGITPDLVRVLDAAQQAATKAGDRQGSRTTRSALRASRYTLYGRAPGRPCNPRWPVRRDRRGRSPCR